MRRNHKFALLLVAAIVVASSLMGTTAVRGYEALLLVAELGGYTPPALLQSRSGTTVQPLCIDRDSRQYNADLYLPENSPKAGIVLLHGATRAGKEDARLVAFARQLAGRGFAVLVPELPGPKQLRIRAEDAQGAAAAFHFLDNYPGLERRVGIGGFSASAALAFLAALEPELREQVSFLLSVGGYHDLTRTIEYAITGRFSLNGELRQQTPNVLGKWLFVLSNLDTLDEPADRVAMRRIALRRMAAPGADIGDLAAELGEEGRVLLDYVTETEADRIVARRNELPAAFARAIAALDLRNKALDTIGARVLLIHGYNDTVIPYTESVALSHRFPPGQVELFLVHGLEHVDSNLERLQDAWHFWRACYALLKLREE
jgi:pimeloyl-ACP methyl ester carboxylesterase